MDVGGNMQGPILPKAKKEKKGKDIVKTAILEASEVYKEVGSFEVGDVGIDQGLEIISQILKIAELILKEDK